MTEKIAIIGMSCRFPGGANNPEEFWNLLMSGEDAISEIPSSRWNMDKYYDPDPDAPGKMNTKKAGILSFPIENFDAHFFNISPKEAMAMDPQQRILLELSWEALERAAINPDTLKNSNASVFVGVTGVDYINTGASQMNRYSMTGCSYSVLAGRLSYVLGLQGPCQSIDTACSTALVAVDNACRYLRLGKTNLALAGGFNLMLKPFHLIGMSKLRAISPDGSCKSFDADANGYVRSEGGGIVVLKRLGDALRDQDPILAVIRGSSINQDGSSTGLAAPSGPAQEKVIQEALVEAGVNASEIDYIETHGTGTPVGDKTEATAIGNLMSGSRDKSAPLLIGSVKSNIGHLEAACGVAGLAKVILSLNNEMIPGNLHFNTPAPNVDWDAYPIQVNSQNTPWKKNRRNRLAGISAFGFSGTNCHLVLEEKPGTPERSCNWEKPFHLLLLSAKTPQVLKSVIQRHIDFLESSSDADLADICYTSQVGRKCLEFRACACGRSIDDMIEELEDLLEEETFERTTKGAAPVFLYTGQGSQYVGMGRQLYETHPVFSQAMDACDSIYRELEGASLLDLIYGTSTDPEQVNTTRNSQPLIFAVEYALTQFWKTLGVEPAAVLGHSIGEYAAACAAGALDLATAMALVISRGRIMSRAQGDGMMLAVQAPPDRIARNLEGLEDRACMAVFNSPADTVVSGFSDTLNELSKILDTQKIPYQTLKVSHGFHSPQMDSILDEFEAIVDGVHLNDPVIPFISNITADQARPGQVSVPSYWREHLRKPVRFSESISYLHQKGNRHFLELGPAPTLSILGTRCLDDPDAVFLHSMRYRVSNWQTITQTMGQLFLQGIEIDWHAFNAPYDYRRIQIPTYPFNGLPYWTDITGQNDDAPESSQTSRETVKSHPVIGQRIESPALQETVIYQTEFSREKNYFFQDHIIMGTETAPGAALLAQVWIAATQIFKEETFCLEQVNFLNVLTLPDGKRQGQIIIKDIESRVSGFEVFSGAHGAPHNEWLLHCKGSIVRIPLNAKRPVMSAKLKNEAPTPHTTFSGEEFYRKMGQLGYDLKNRFRVIQHVEISADRVLCEMKFPDRDGETLHYPITPNDLDAIIQSPAGDAFDHKEVLSDHVMLPFAVQRITCYQPVLAPGNYTTICTSGGSDARHPGRTASKKELQCFDEDGRLCLHIEGFIAVNASRYELHKQDIVQRTRNFMHETDWIPLPLGSSDQNLSAPWVIVRNRDEPSDLVMEILRERSQPVFEIISGTENRALVHGGFELNALDSGAYLDVLNRLNTMMPGHKFQIIHLSPMDNRQFHIMDMAGIESKIEKGLRSLLYLTQAMVKSGTMGRLYAVSMGCYCFGTHHIVAPEQGCTSGFVHAAQSEHPELQITHIDLPKFPGKEDFLQLADEIAGMARDQRIALRSGIRYAARLRGLGPVSFPENNIPKEYALEISERGSLENLVFKPLNRTEPFGRQVEFEVVATGLNFRDVLNVLGQYPGDPGRAGSEAAGIVTRVGDKVKGFLPGDAVVCRSMSGAFDSHITIDQSSLILKPDCLSFEQAATTPIAFMTAYYALYELAALKKGEGILIHAGAGGVGMAAIQLARLKGARIFSTAGSPGKRALLEEMGVDHIMNSRTIDFADKIMEITDGKGVDVVLNALTGNMLEKSLKVLGSDGRFLEMGKKEILTAEQVQTVNPGIKYMPFDLGDAMKGSPHCREDILLAVFELFASQKIKPIALQTFPIEEVTQAFRYMSQAKNTGKIAVSHQNMIRKKRLKDTVPVRADSAYLITGGLGGLGLEVARWMARNRAGAIFLVSRRQPDKETKKILKQMEGTGTRVRHLQGDISSRADVARIVAESDASGLPLKGIIHAAGILSDRMITEQDWENYTGVFAPKVHGSWHLHRATENRVLDFFVMFSSMASTLGSMGQSNYSAANGFMNSLVDLRKSRGMAGTSICWGPWAQVGMAAQQANRGQRMKAQGLNSIRVEDGLLIMANIIQSGAAVPTVLDIKWDKFLQSFSQDMTATFLGEIQKKNRSRGTHAQAGPAPGGNAVKKLIVQLKGSRADKRWGLMNEFVRKITVRVMGHDNIEMVQVDTPLTDIGFDSLMAVEIRNQLGKYLDLNLPVSLLFDYPTIEEISRLLLVNMGLDTQIKVTEV